MSDSKKKIIHNADQAARRSLPFARLPNRTSDAVARLCATLGCAPQPAKQEPLGGHHRTSALAHRTTIAAFTVVPLARHRREIGSGERNLGARVLPLSPGRRFIRHGNDRSHPLDRTVQICPASDRRRRLRCAQWAVEVHRNVPAYVARAQLLSLRAVELTQLDEDGPAQV
uniref:Uncharacterized protein n=1 Tax=Oryza barthii TaxID=65489 RepID=A0A0D3GTG5_9ORYZ